MWDNQEKPDRKGVRVRERGRVEGGEDGSRGNNATQGIERYCLVSDQRLRQE